MKTSRRIRTSTLRDLRETRHARLHVAEISGVRLELDADGERALDLAGRLEGIRQLVQQHVAFFGCRRGRLRRALEPLDGLLHLIFVAVNAADERGGLEA